MKSPPPIEICLMNSHIFVNNYCTPINRTNLVKAWRGRKNKTFCTVFRSQMYGLTKPHLTELWQERKILAHSNDVEFIYIASHSQPPLTPTTPIQVFSKKIFLHILQTINDSFYCKKTLNWNLERKSHFSVFKSQPDKKSYCEY